MSYRHTNSQGVSYFLHRTDVTLKGGRPQTIYFFARDGKRVRGTPVDLPPGSEVVENPRTGLVVIRKIRDRTRDDDSIPDESPPDIVTADPATGEGAVDVFGFTVHPSGEEIILGRFRPLEASPLSLSARVLKEAISDPGVTERDLQLLLEKYPELIPGDYFEAMPQIVFELDEDVILRPDFMLRPVDDLWDLLEIKRPQLQIVVQSGNHPRFSQEMASAIQQVRDYSAALENPQVRERLQERYQIEAFKPKAMLIAGRSLQADHRLYRRLSAQAASEIQLYTWDHFVEINKKRGMLRK
jgi:hypothetical protein